jgi:ornithine lipid hydroxylase
MQLVFSRFGYIICITTIVGASIFLIEFASYSELQVLFFAALGSIFFTVLGEFYIPLFKDWKPNFKENFFPDVSLFVVNYILLQSQLLQIFIASIAISFSGGGFNLWPSDSNIVFQLVLALVISEFGLYWFHRVCHEIPFLWRFHKIHHNPGRLYWFNATRFHYLDVTLLQVSCSWILATH